MCTLLQHICRQEVCRKKHCFMQLMNNIMLPFFRHHLPQLLLLKRSLESLHCYNVRFCLKISKLKLIIVLQLQIMNRDS